MKISFLITALLITLTIAQNCTANKEIDCPKCGDYYFFDGKCLPCLNAKDEYSCELCKGFSFIQNQCKLCSQFKNPGQCQECRGYFFMNNKCSPCELAPAYLCNLQCPDYFLKRGICTHCSLASDNITCKSCASSFEFKNGKCIQCPKHYITSNLDYECMSCVGLSNGVMCSFCPQYYFSNSFCQPCKGATVKQQCSLCPQFYFNGSICNHCNAASQQQCLSCKNHIFINGFCVPCRLVGNATSCQTCVMFRYSTDRQMCVPCKMKGHYLTSNNTCDHCLNANTEQNCKLCPGFAFDRKTRACLNCSQIIDNQKCRGCLNFYYSNLQKRCTSCSNAGMIECLISCEGYFYSIDKTCKKYSQATNINDCKSCGKLYFWSTSGKCTYCTAPDFFLRNDECVPCSLANETQCSYCSYYFSKNGKCTPCKYANSSLQCMNCNDNFFYFSSKNTCQTCVLASSQECNQNNCPGFAFYNNSCVPSAEIKTQAACIQYPFFSFTILGCRYCIKKSEYLKPKTLECFQCESFKNQVDCYNCAYHFYNQNTSSCLSCSTIQTLQLCNKCHGHVFTSSNQCVPCSNLTSQTDCNACNGYFYRRGECLRCTQAQNLLECSKCRNHGFENSICKRCEGITDYLVCQKQCAPQGYYSSSKLNICLSCSNAQSNLTCSNCVGYSWNMNTNKCLNCNLNSEICQSCSGMFWNGKYCQVCMTPGCLRCNQSNICLQCKTSFLMSSNQTCNKVCNAQYCRICTELSSNFCIQCKPDYTYIPSRAQCILDCQVTRCVTCTTNSVCKVCEDGYTLNTDNTACLCGIPNCDSCQNLLSNSTNSTNPSKKVICSRCLIGYSLDNITSECIKIKCNLQKCRICRNTTACQICQVGWSPDRNRLCTSICSIPGCSKCSSIMSCQSCMSGYILKNDRQCSINCNIKNCIECADNLSCLKCDPKFELSKDKVNCTIKCENGLFKVKQKCEKCLILIPQCELCSYSNTSQVICSICQPSYFTNNGKCTSCGQISPNCLSCSFQNSVFRCLTCAFGYNYFNNRCRRCSDNCVSCKQAGQDDCDQCILGYTYNYEATTNVKCINCLGNCKQCKHNNISLCMSCMDGYYLRNNQCKRCENSCMKCKDQLGCTECFNGYFLNGNSCQQKKISNCKIQAAYDRDNVCLQCQPGYQTHNQDRACIASKCSQYSTCMTCPAGKYLSQKKCRDCGVNYCTTCNSPNDCKTCQDGYYLSNSSRCVNCIEGCRKCSGKYNCIEARTGYYIQSNFQLPIKCPKECKRCSNPYFCQECNADYAFYKFKCLDKQYVTASVVIKPTKQQWNSMNSMKRMQFLLTYWSIYQTELLRLIGYEGRQQLVFIDNIKTGSARFYMIINRLPSEDPQRIQNQIYDSMNKQSNLMKVISIEEITRYTLDEKGERGESRERGERNRDKKQKQSKSSSSVNIGLLVALIIVSLVLLALILFVGMKYFFKTRVSPNHQPAKQSSNKLCFDKQLKQQASSENNLGNLHFGKGRQDVRGERQTELSKNDDGFNIS